MTDKITRKEFAELKQRVAELEEQLQSKSKPVESNTVREIDEYDTYVLERNENPADAHPRHLVKLYRQAGIQDSSKRKQRAKRLKQLAQEDDLL